MRAGLLLGLLLLGAAPAGALAQGEVSLAVGPGHGSNPHREGAEGGLANLLAAAGPGLREADGTISWKALADIGTIRRENTGKRYGPFVAYYAEPVVREDLKRLAGQTVRVRGYMLPRAGVEGLSRFLVSALPAADADGCASGGVETVVDVIVAGPVEARVDRLVTVQGRLTLFDPQRWAGYIYRIADATVVQGD